jgi:hypothetical protein
VMKRKISLKLKYPAYKQSRGVSESSQTVVVVSALVKEEERGG